MASYSWSDRHCEETIRRQTNIMQRVYELHRGILIGVPLSKIEIVGQIFEWFVFPELNQNKDLIGVGFFWVNQGKVYQEIPRSA